MYQTVANKSSYILNQDVTRYLSISSAILNYQPKGNYQSSGSYVLTQDVTHVLFIYK